MATEARASPANPLLTGPILSTLVSLSLPNMVAMLATALVAVAETSYVGLLGTPALAGLALVFPMVMLQQMMSSGAMGGGVSSAISRALGAGQEARASALALHAVVIGMIGGSLSALLFLVWGRAIFRLLGGRDEALAAALAYSDIVFLGAVSIWLTNTLASIIRGGGNMKVPSMTVLVVAVGQIFIGGGFGLGIGPLPRLGMTGIALGPVVAFTCSAAFLLWFLAGGRGRVRLRFTGVPLQWTLFREILEVGALACVSPLQTILTVLVLTRVVSEFGTEALAGYGIGVRLEFLLVPIAFAVGVACVPMVGMAIGAGNVARARAVAWTGALISAVLLGAIGALVAAFPDVWARLFTSSDGVLAAARTYLSWAGPGYAFFGIGLCLYFASQGAGRVLGPVIAGTVRLAFVAAGGWWLAASHAPVWMLFALIGAAMVVYGVVTALAVHLVSWQPSRP